jgi:NAD(P)-dependent dehydrogenase (short-subunit alcohol dehydrogenase family)
VTVASVAHQSAQLEFADLQGEYRYDGYAAYAASKLCNILFTYELADRLADAGVTANCLHPGVVATKLLEAGFPGLGGASVIEGARTLVYLATSPEVAEITGTYFVGGRPTRSSAVSYDLTARRRLWSISEQLVGVGGDAAGTERKPPNHSV